VVEEDGGRHEGTGEAPASRLVGPGDKPKAQGAVELEQPAARTRRARARLGAGTLTGAPVCGSLRGSRFGREASR
jgi:hypothetical protein